MYDGDDSDGDDDGDDDDGNGDDGDDYEEVLLLHCCLYPCLRLTIFLDKSPGCC